MANQKGHGPKTTQSVRKERSSDENRPIDLFTTLARTSLFLESIQRECLGEHGLAFSEYSVLRLIQREPEQDMTPKYLADQIICTSGAMTKIVDRLEREKLVRRIPDAGDRRRIFITLTERGNARANMAAEAYQSGRERVLARLKKAEAKQVHESLNRLLGALEEDRRHPR